MKHTTNQTPNHSDANDRTILSLKDAGMVVGGATKPNGPIKICPKCGAPITCACYNKHMETHK